MSKAKPEEKAAAKESHPFARLAVVIGLPPIAAQARVEELPSDLRSPIIAEMRNLDVADRQLLKTFNKACARYAAANKASDAASDKAEE